MRGEQNCVLASRSHPSLRGALATKQSIFASRAGLLRFARNDARQCGLAARWRPSFCSTNNEKPKTPDPIPSDDRRRWYRLHLDRTRTTTNQEGETPTDACSFRPHLRMRPRALISFSSACGEAGRARSPVGVPPRRLRQRTNAAAQLQHALPGTRSGRTIPMVRKTVRCFAGVTRAVLSQSSELLADRSSCRPGVKPEPPESASDEPPPAGTALAPAAGVTRIAVL
jgi:hypothetical protein